MLIATIPIRELMDYDCPENVKAVCIDDDEQKDGEKVILLFQEAA